MLHVGLFDRAPVIRQRRHLVDWTASTRAAERHIWPIWFETEFSVRPGKSVKIMRLTEGRLAIEPAGGAEVRKCAALGNPQHLIDQLPRAHLESTVLRTKAFGERANHFMIVAAFPGRLDQFRPKNEILVPASAINIVVLEEGRCRKHHVCHLSCLRHELLMNADEEILASKALLDLVLVGRNRDRIGVLDDQRLNGTTALQRLSLAGQDPADARLVKHAHRAVTNVEALDQGLVELKNIGADMKRAAPFVLPGPRHRRDATGRVRICRAVARTREAVAQSEK